MEERRRNILESIGLFGITAIAGCNSMSDDTSDTTTESTVTVSSQESTTRTPTATLTPTSTTSETPTSTTTETPTSTTTETPTSTTTETPTSTTTETPTSTTTETPVSTSLRTQSNKITATDSDTDDWFGMSVALSDDGLTAIIGAPGDEEPNVGRAGSAYVFSRETGSWIQEAKLTAEDGDSDDQFGMSVAVSSDGSTAIIGARFDEDPNGERAGSAYVFSRTDSSWTQEAKLVAEDGDSYDEFGRSVALSDDGSTGIIGAFYADSPNVEDTGSAYVFSRSDGAWSQEAKLIAEDGEMGDGFGTSVAVANDGSTTVIGALGDSNTNGEGAGSAYVFSRSDSSWIQEAKLTAEDGDSGDDFGRSVAMSADGLTAIIGARFDEDPNGNAAGSAYVFSRTNSSWTQEEKIAAADGDSNDRFGISVSLSADGSIAVIGAYWDEDPNGERSGSAYMFERENGIWAQESKLVAEDGDSIDSFGTSVVVSSDGSTAIIGAYGDENSTGRGAGSIYVYE